MRILVALGRLAPFALLVSLVASGCLVVAPLDDPPSESSGGRGGGRAGNDAGRGGSGGDRSDDAGNDAAEPMGSGGRDPDGGSVATGGNGPAGSAGATPCETNADCVAGSGDEPHRCRVEDGECVPLKASGCPLAYGEEGWKDPNAIVFGAFATLNPTVPADTPAVWAYRLALDELNREGLPGPGGTRRPLVMIVCNNETQVDIERALRHLADEVRVPAVLANLKPYDLWQGFNRHYERRMLFLSPVGADRTLVDEDEDDLVWHLLGQPSDFAPAYAELLRLLERYLIANGDVGERSLRIAMVTTTEAFDAELAKYVREALRFNGKTAQENGPDFLGVELDLDEPSIPEIADEILSFRPDVVISAAGAAFTESNGLLELIETNYRTYVDDAGVPRAPYYLLSPVNSGSLNNVTSLIESLLTSGLDPNANRRFLGVSAAGPVDKNLQNDFERRLLARFPEARRDLGNFYDAVYFLAYAVHGAPDSMRLTGPGIVNGLLRLLEGDAYDVGPQSIGLVFSALEQEERIALHGTLGPPDFLPQGLRRDDGSVFCFENSDDVLFLRKEALRYDRATGEFTGEFRCFPGFHP